MVTKYLDPKNDLAFRKIFGSEKHKGIPIDFLNASLCLEGEDRIEDLEFLNTVQPPEIEARKESIVDVLVRDHKGTKYIVEMQVAKTKGLRKEPSTTQPKPTVPISTPEINTQISKK